MTLQPENRAPSFYTFAAFRPGRRTLLYGGLLSTLAFWAVTFVFNYGIHEKLLASFEAVQSGTISASPADTTKRAFPVAASPEHKIVRVALPDQVLRFLAGTYFSAQVNRKYLVTFDDGRLNLQIDGLEREELIPVSGHSLYADEERWIEFAATPAGTIDRLDIYDQERHIIATRP